MAQENESLEIVVCLGSSCFARGNSENLAVLKQYESQCGDMHVRLSGCLCQDECRQSPNLTVGGKAQHGVTPQKLQEILEKLGCKSGSNALVAHGQA